MFEDRIALARALTVSSHTLTHAIRLVDETRRARGTLYVLGDPACAPLAQFLSTGAGPSPLTVAGYRSGVRSGDLLLGLSADTQDDSFRYAMTEARRAGASTVAVTGPSDRAPLAAQAWLRLPVRDPALLQEGQLAVWHHLSAAAAEGSPVGTPEHSTGPAALDDLLALRTAWRSAGLTLAWTNGCFDLVHAGHAAFLEQVRARGDMLVVGLNSDASVRRLKGPERPFLDFESRAAVLRSMRAVDHVVQLRGDLPSEEIELLQPDVCCKDDSYLALPLPERSVVESYGGRMVLLPRIAGRSTTQLAARIRDSRAAAGSP
ncbi:adenylyltransferase/cytidyltransferase family protein [Dactylosporangium matsuzakiense]|uniref:SIS domain-containing protein n=1 Tax=Dactylosporangium matsuzakiense TaxID=53360 RepID=A0A9W6KJ40_9ACTN|nr:adenylyltransferase/cytidyltransferase family protein [Dactylosporangium matsuzakiense]GLL02133.1 hypothetical protein GCM10017581_038750 [Dactylosporangium matsuzakiense]